MFKFSINVENFSIALETIISSHDPNNKTYIMGNFNMNLLDYYNSAPIENFQNQMISIFFSWNYASHPTRVLCLMTYFVRELVNNI